MDFSKMGFDLCDSIECLICDFRDIREALRYLMSHLHKVGEVLDKKKVQTIHPTSGFNLATLLLAHTDSPSSPSGSL